LYPVLPRFRVGIASLAGATDGVAVDAAANFGMAAEPTATAVIKPPDLRKVRRLLREDLPAGFLLMVASKKIEGQLDARHPPRVNDQNRTGEFF
jgi:hypothetical protein